MLLIICKRSQFIISSINKCRFAHQECSNSQEPCETAEETWCAAHATRPRHHPPSPHQYSSTVQARHGVQFPVVLQVLEDYQRHSTKHPIACEFSATNLQQNSVITDLFRFILRCFLNTAAICKIGSLKFIFDDPLCSFNPVLLPTSCLEV
jgi:hypothetical protein